MTTQSANNKWTDVTINDLTHFAFKAFFAVLLASLPFVAVAAVIAALK